MAFVVPHMVPQPALWRPVDGTSQLELNRINIAVRETSLKIKRAPRSAARSDIATRLQGQNHSIRFASPRLSRAGHSRHSLFYFHRAGEAELLQYLSKLGHEAIRRASWDCHRELQSDLQIRADPQLR